MVQINSVDFAYSAKRSLFKNLDLTLSNGRIYGLLGKNGAGKTTLLKLIAGLLFPTSGAVSIGGEDPAKRKPSTLSQVFFLPEEFNTPAMTTQKYGDCYGIFYPAFDSGQYQDLLLKLEVETDRSMAKMSFGQKKKAMIAFALACNTPLLIMDEPTNGLDIPSKAIFRRIIASTASENRTIVISTHQVRDLDQLIDSIVILEQSRILLNASTTQISEHLLFKNLEPTETALHSEQTPHGLWGVVPNTTGEESPIDLELLFNAAIEHPDFFITNFSK